MRLDPLDGTRSPRSPSHTHANGNLRSPGRGAGLLGSNTNGHSHPRADSNGYPHQNGTEKIRRSETYHGHNREEVTRILIQSLDDLGYSSAADKLIQESGYPLEGSTVAAFRKAVLDGQWVEAETLLFGTSKSEEGGGVELRERDSDYSKGHSKTMANSKGARRPSKGLTLAEDSDEVEMKFLLREQKYLEYLENSKTRDALTVLRQELRPLDFDQTRLHSLAGFMMCSSPQQLRQQASWDGAQGKSRQELLSQLSKSISPSVMIPEHRLAKLLDHVKRSWIEDCLYHNTPQSPSLYVDHKCDANGLPRKAMYTLAQHRDEVWFLAYSHDGTRLATAGKDSDIYIYDTTNYGLQRKLQGHGSGVCFLAWSPDDTKLLSCSVVPDNSVKIWDINLGESVRDLTDFTYPTTAAAWAPNGLEFVTGSQDVNHALVLWSKDGTPLYKWTGAHLRVNDVAISPDGQCIVVLLMNGIQVYDYQTRVKRREYTFDDLRLISVRISSDSQHMLISMTNSKIRLMSIDTGETIESFDGAAHHEFIVRSSFGGAQESFVVSGSDDSRIYIWRTSGRLVETINAHSRGCVNAISWHPRNPYFFASAGDDHKVRIWST